MHVVPVAHRWVRLRKVALGALLTVAILVCAPPLVLRGPVLGWVVDRALAARCGSFSVAGGHLSLTSVPRLVLGRPLALTLDGVSIHDAGGRPVLEVRRAELVVKVRLSPVRITVTNATLADGRWRFASDAEGRGSADVFDALPTGGRDACGAPTYAAASGRASRSAQLIVERGRLSNIDVDLDFPVWRLSLAHVSTTYSLAVADGFRFDVGRAVATGGRLRVGPTGSAWATTVPFDAVVLDRVVVVPETGTDLMLEVAEARSGRAKLAGQARFRNIFAGTARDAPPAGLDLEAGWRTFGDALTVLEAPWRPRGDWMRHLDGDLHATIHGPFDNLSVTVAAQAEKTRIEADLASGVANLRVECAGADTSWMMVPALRPLLGGRLRGTLAAWLRLSPSFRGLDAEVSDADLHLDREAQARGPTEVVVRVGRAAQEAPPARALSGQVRRIRLADGRLDIVDARLRWTRLHGRAAATIDWTPDGGWPIEAAGTLVVGSLADWLPTDVARGSLRLSARLVGSLERLRLDLFFPSASQLSIGQQGFHLPSALVLRWNERDGLRLLPFLMRAESGGFVELSGRLRRDDRIDAHVLVRGYALQAFPWYAAQIRAMGATGVLRGDMVVTGGLGDLAVSGSAHLSSLALRGRNIGQGTAKLAWRSDHGRVEGRVGPSLGFQAKLRRWSRLAVDVELSVEKQALGPWLPAPLLGAPLTASGKASLAYTAGATPQVMASLDIAGAGLTNLHLDVRSTGQTRTGHLAGEVDIAAWPALWSRYLSAAMGALHVDLATDVALGGPVSGDLTVVRDLRLRLRRPQGTVYLFAGDRLHVDGDQISTLGLRVEGSWFRGRIAGRIQTGTGDLSTMPLSLAAVGTVDLARLPALLPGFNLAGQAKINAGAQGTLGPDPGAILSGEVALTSVVLRSPSLPPVTIQGTVVAQDNRLVTRGMTADIAGVGRVTVGKASVASLTLLSLFPLRFGQVAVPFSGSNLTIPSAPVQIRDLDIDGRLSGSPGAFAFTGDVWVAGGVLRPSRIEAQRSGPRRPWYSSIPPGLVLDLRLHGQRKAMRVAVPVLPDITVDFDCRLRADRHAASLNGSLHGDGTYDRAAVDLYAWLAGRELRRCQIEEVER